MTTTIAARHWELLSRLEGRSEARVGDLAQEMGKSPVTIRRDLLLLQDKGLVTRTHGGARLAYQQGEELPYELAAEVRRSQKACIGRAAADLLVRHGDSIILDAGSTVTALADALRGKRDLKVITNSVAIIPLAASESWTVLCTGGVLRGKSLAFVGPAAQKSIEALRAQTLFLALNGIDDDGSVYTLDSFSAAMKQAMLRCASKVVALGDSSKIGKPGLVKVTSLSSIDIVVTDDEATPEQIASLRQHGVAVIVAGKRGAEQYGALTVRRRPAADDTLLVDSSPSLDSLGTRRRGDAAGKTERGLLLSE